MSDSPRSVVQWNVSFAGVIVGVLAVVGIIVYFSAFHESTPSRPQAELTFYEEYLIEEASHALADEMPAVTGLQSVIFVPLRDEESKGALAVEAFHEALRENGRYQSVSREAVRKAIDKMLPDGGDVSSHEQALTLVREFLLDAEDKPVADGVLLTRAEVEGRIGDQARVFIEAEIVAARSGLPAIVPTAHTSKIESKWTWAWFVGTMNETSLGWRMFIWAALVGFLPFAMSGLVKLVTKREKNRDNAYMVLAFTAFAGLFAWFLVGFYIHGALSGMMVFSALCVGGLYSLWACTHIYEKSQ